MVRLLAEPHSQHAIRQAVLLHLGALAAKELPSQMFASRHERRSPGPLQKAASVLRAGEGGQRAPAGGNCEQIQGHILAIRDARCQRVCRGLSPLLEVYAANRGSIDRAMRPRLMTLSGETP